MTDVAIMHADDGREGGGHGGAPVGRRSFDGCLRSPGRQYNRSGPRRPGSGTGDGAPGSAQFGNPFGLAIDGSRNLYVTGHGTHRVRKVDPAGFVTTLGGSSQGYADGPARSARFDGPAGIVVDSGGTVFVADRQNHRIRKISFGMVTTYAGSGPTGSGNGSFDDAMGLSARFNEPVGLAVDSSGKLYVADWQNHRIRAVVP